MLFFSLFLTFIMLTVHQSSRMANFMIFIALISHPTQLLIERANYDIVIMLLLALFAICIKKNYLWLSLVTVILTSLFKFYTTPLLVWLFFIWRIKIRQILVLALLCCTSFVIIDDLRKMQVDFPRPSWAGFGNSIFGTYVNRLDFEFPKIIQDLIGVIMLLITLLILNKIVNAYNLKLPYINVFVKPNTYTDSIYSIFLIVFLSCFFSSTSFDYRLIYLMVPAAIYISKLEITNSFRCGFLLLLTFTAWLSFNSGPFEPFGDLAILVWVAIFTRNLLIELRDIFKITNKFYNFSLDFISKRSN